MTTDRPVCSVDIIGGYIMSIDETIEGDRWAARFTGTCSVFPPSSPAEGADNPPTLAFSWEIESTGITIAHCLSNMHPTVTIPLRVGANPVHVTNNEAAARNAIERVKDTWTRAILDALPSQPGGR